MGSAVHKYMVYCCFTGIVIGFRSEKVHYRHYISIFHHIVNAGYINFLLELMIFKQSVKLNMRDKMAFAMLITIIWLLYAFYMDEIYLESAIRIVFSSKKRKDKLLDQSVTSISCMIRKILAEKTSYYSRFRKLNLIHAQKNWCFQLIVAYLKHFLIVKLFESDIYICS